MEVVYHHVVACTGNRFRVERPTWHVATLHGDTLYVLVIRTYVVPTDQHVHQKCSVSIQKTKIFMAKCLWILENYKSTYFIIERLKCSLHRKKTTNYVCLTDYEAVAVSVKCAMSVGLQLNTISIRSQTLDSERTYLSPIVSYRNYGNIFFVDLSTIKTAKILFIACKQSVVVMKLNLTAL